MQGVLRFALARSRRSLRAARFVPEPVSTQPLTVAARMSRAAGNSEAHSGRVSRSGPQARRVHVGRTRHRDVRGRDTGHDRVSLVPRPLAQRPARGGPGVPDRYGKPPATVPARCPRLRDRPGCAGSPQSASDRRRAGIALAAPDRADPADCVDLRGRVRVPCRARRTLPVVYGPRAARAAGAADDGSRSGRREGLFRARRRCIETQRRHGRCWRSRELRRYLRARRNARGA